MKIWTALPELREQESIITISYMWWNNQGLFDSLPYLLEQELKWASTSVEKKKKLENFLGSCSIYTMEIPDEKILKYDKVYNVYDLWEIAGNKNLPVYFVGEHQLDVINYDVWMSLFKNETDSDPNKIKIKFCGNLTLRGKLRSDLWDY